ncbi:MAG TPA: pentapeptide repeat-containing protein [Phycisphaerae bacterium]|nr:pentapeptide repeat-containing protein [Phycisphaerae bacterium]
MATATLTPERLQEILKAHELYLAGSPEGTRADLSRKNLSEANLSGADLSRANLSEANLSRANLSRANLYGANLSGADLSGANLYGADLSGASLYGADLSGASLYGADLSGASLSGASLYGANLSGANLYGADLKSTKDYAISIARTRILAEGALIGWKKCQGEVIVKLRIPEDARRSHAFGRKCRAEFVEVVEVIGGDKGISKHDGVTEYTVGSVVRCDKWEEDWSQECAGGVHFFITREEAEAY